MESFIKVLYIFTVICLLMRLGTMHVGAVIEREDVIDLDLLKKEVESSCEKKGILEVVSVDYEEQGFSDLRYFLNEERGEKYELFFNDENIFLQSGSRVTIFCEGDSISSDRFSDSVILDGKLHLIDFDAGVKEEEIGVVEAQQDTFEFKQDQNTLVKMVFESRDIPVELNLGGQKAVFIRVKFANEQEDFMTEEEALELMGIVSDFYLENSYGKTWIDADVFGYYDLPFFTGMDVSYILDYLLNDPVIGEEVDWTQYRRIFVAWGPGEYNTWSGLGQIGGSDKETYDGTVYSSYAFLSGPEGWDVGTTAHELGHNLGVAHANDLECGRDNMGFGVESLDGCESVVYGDMYDIMGYSSSVAHMSAYHKEIIGWFDQGEIVEVNDSNYGVYKIGPIETSNSYLQGVKIPRLNSSGQFINYDSKYCDIFEVDCYSDYYLEYRRPVGFDDTMNESLIDGVFIRLEHYINGDTQLIDNTPHFDNDWEDSGDVVLRQGQEFFDIHTNFSIRVLNITEEYAEVEIFEGLPSLYARLISPKQEDYGYGNFFEIIGTVIGQDYVLEYKLEQETEWSIFAEGTEKINEVLGVLDLINLDEAWYDIRLTVNDLGLSTQTQSKLYVLKGIQEGWPQSTADIVSSSVALYDVDNDGTQEIFAGTKDGWVYGWYSDGTLLDNFPLAEGWVFDEYVLSSPAIGDITGDGESEIVYADFSFYKVHAYHWQGYPVDGWPASLGSYLVGSRSAPVLADMDNDGVLDVIMAKLSGEIVVVDGHANMLQGWPQGMERRVESTPAVYDLDNDGYNEVVVTFDRGISVLEHDGNLKWTQDGGYKDSSPIIADIDGYGEQEIINLGYKNKVYVRKSNGDVFSPGWPKNFSDQPVALAVGNIDEDEELEIIFVLQDQNLLYALNSDASVVEGWPISLNTATSYYNAITLSDINNDDQAEIILGLNDGLLYAFNSDASVVEGWPKITGVDLISFGSAIGDIDNDGDVEVVVPTREDFLKSLLIFDLGCSYNADHNEWPMFQFNSQNTGCYNCDMQSCSDRTLLGQCSLVQPKYCEDNMLSNRCDLCGCPGDIFCRDDGSCGDLICGDVNVDDLVNILDIVYLINYIYKGGPIPSFENIGDVNLDEEVNIQDVIYLINYLYKNGPEPICE